MIFKKLSEKKGLSLLEVIIVIALMLILISIASVGLSPIRGKVPLSTSVSVLVSDIKSAQIKAMVGDTEGRAAKDIYGIYFDTDSYILFHGLNYVPGEPSNSVIDLSAELAFESVLFPSRIITFASGSGEIVNFSQNNNSIVIKDAITGEEKTVTVNRYGAVSVN